MSPLTKFSAAVVLALAATAVPSAHAQTTTAPVPVNVNQNIVTIVLVLGVAIAVTLIYVLAKLIPKIRRGEVSIKSFEFDWRAELLNQTPQKEKARQAEEKARRAEERAAAVDVMEFTERGTQHCRVNEPLSPREAAVPGTSTSDSRVQVDVFASEDRREAH